MRLELIGGLHVFEGLDDFFGNLDFLANVEIVAILDVDGKVAMRDAPAEAAENLRWNGEVPCRRA